jgi:transposase
MHKGLRLSGWIGAHVNALNMIGGVPKAVVCDNLKAGVTAVCRYEARRPGLHRCRRLQLSHCPINAPTG